MTKLFQRCGVEKTKEEVEKKGREEENRGGGKAVDLWSKSSVCTF